MILTDTCVLIEYFKEKPEVTEIIKDTDPKSLVLNSVIVMELLAGARNKVELNSIKKRLNEFRVLEINQSVMDDAGFLMENYYLSHGLKIPDAIIATTSRYHGVSLFTFNKKDFRYIPDIEFFN